MFTTEVFLCRNTLGSIWLFIIPLSHCRASYAVQSPGPQITPAKEQQQWCAEPNAAGEPRADTHGGGKKHCTPLQRGSPHPSPDPCMRESCQQAAFRSCRQEMAKDPKVCYQAQKSLIGSHGLNTHPRRQHLQNTISAGCKKASHCHQEGHSFNVKYPKPKIISRNYNKQLLLLGSSEQGKSSTNTAASWLRLVFPRAPEITKSLFHTADKQLPGGSSCSEGYWRQSRPERKQSCLGKPSSASASMGTEVLERLEIS